MGGNTAGTDMTYRGAGARDNGFLAGGEVDGLFSAERKVTWCRGFRKLSSSRNIGGVGEQGVSDVICIDRWRGGYLGLRLAAWGWDLGW